MSFAALPAKYGYASKEDKKHPLFPIYQQRRAACSRLMVNSSDFKDWLSCYENELVRARAANDPRYSKFLDWMIENQGGARKCPAGMFPHNFYFWCEGGRW